MPREPVYYGSYLALDELLGAQRLESERSGRPAHDEMLFIIVHQAYELWFKQILWELEAVIRIFDDDAVRERDMARAVAHLERIGKIQHLILGQIDVLETMTPLDFLDFRDALVPASGFQSVQFRLIENLLGMRPDDRLTYGGRSHDAPLSDADRQRLVASLDRPSLFTLVERWLERTPFLDLGDEFAFRRSYESAVQSMLDQDEALIERQEVLSEAEREAELRTIANARLHFSALFDDARHDELVASVRRRMSLRALRAALLINLYRDEPILHQPFRLLRTLTDIDENLTLWRHRHALMVMRMIGSKTGTGGSSGHDYLRRTAAEHRIYQDLVNLATFLVPRSKLPELPEKLSQAMDFRFSGSTS